MGDIEVAAAPFFSPGGEWVGLRDGDTLKMVRLTGGRTETICNLPEGVFGSASWSPDDTIWLGDGSSGLYRVAAAGGVPQLVTTPGAANEGVVGHSGPQPLPDGRAILYTAFRRSRANILLDLYLGAYVKREVAVYAPDTDEHTILADGWFVCFTSSGHVVYSRNRGGTLWAFPFDIDRLERTGEPFQVWEGVRDFGRAEAHLGSDGTLIYVHRSGPTDDRALVWVNRDGREEPIGAPLCPDRAPRLSPDGTRVAVSYRPRVPVLTYGRTTWCVEPSHSSRAIPAMTMCQSGHQMDRMLSSTPIGIPMLGPSPCIGRRPMDKERSSKSTLIRSEPLHRSRGRVTGALR